MNTESLLEANKDDAIRAQEIAITKANKGEYPDALKFAMKAQRMNPGLPKIKKLAALMEILSAPSDTTHYKLLGVEETDNAKKIGSTYRKLSIDVHPDQNTFPKASEAFKRIAIAARVLSDEESRAKYDRALAAARESAHEAARNAAAREAVARKAAARNATAREAVARKAAARNATAREAAAREAAARESAAREAAARKAAAREAAAREAAARESAAREAASRDVAAREDAASCDFYDAFSGESFSTDTSSTDTSYTDASSTDDSSTNASSTDDVGPGSKRASDAQATSTLHTPKKRREGHGPL